MIKTVFFDIDGTLLDFDAATKHSIKVASEVHGITMPDNILEIFRPINNDLWKRVENSELDIVTLRKIRWNTIFSHIGIDYDGEKFEKTFYPEISNSAVPISGALDLLEYLSKKYTVCAATNAMTDQQAKRLKKCQMDKFIDHLFTSEMLGASKPSPAFFDGCFEKLGNPEKNTVIIIGDSMKADIKGGKSYGLKTIYFDLLHNDGHSNEYADFTVYDLGQIKNIL